MITRESTKQVWAPLSAGFEGRVLVAEEDGAGFLFLDAKPAAGQKIQSLLSIKGAQWHHIYVCLSGKVSIQCQGKKYILKTDDLLAIPSALDGSLEASEDSWIAMIYSRTPPGESAPTVPLYLELSDVIGGKFDIDWVRGRSRRYLLKKDAFGVTVTNTTAYPGFSNPLQYVNQVECAYWIEGQGCYRWNDGACSQPFDLRREGEGCMMLMDQHDKHEACLAPGDRTNITICVFCPALAGAESHKFDGSDSTY